LSLPPNNESFSDCAITEEVKNRKPNKKNIFILT